MRMLSFECALQAEYGLSDAGREQAAAAGKSFARQLGADAAAVKVNSSSQRHCL